MALRIQASLSQTRAARAQRSAAPSRTCIAYRGLSVLHKRQLPSFVVRADADKTPTDGSAEFDKLLKDLQEKWDAVENKTAVAIYGGASVVVLWFASAIVSAVNTVPLLPKLLELVGLGYTAWFVYRYLLFKSSREELVADIEELKKKISE